MAGYGWCNIDPDVHYVYLSGELTRADGLGKTNYAQVSLSIAAGAETGLSLIPLSRVRAYGPTLRYLARRWARYLCSITSRDRGVWKSCHLLRAGSSYQWVIIIIIIDI